MWGVRRGLLEAAGVAAAVLVGDAASGKIRKFKIEIKALFCLIIVKLVEVSPTYLYINV